MWLSCKQASRLMSERMERGLDRRERSALRLHLWLCGECRRFSRQLGALRRALRRAHWDGECCAHQELPPEARERIARALARRAEDDGREAP